MGAAGIQLILEAAGNHSVRVPRKGPRGPRIALVIDPPSIALAASQQINIGPIYRFEMGPQQPSHEINLIITVTSSLRDLAQGIFPRRGIDVEPRPVPPR
jgi:hypothetical protein